MTPTPKPSRPWMPLAQRILLAAADNRHAEAAQLMQELLDRHGSGAGLPALFAMIDTANISMGHHDGRPRFGLTFLCADTGEYQTVEHVDPAVAWAGRLMVARAALDRDQAEALIKSVPSDKQWSANILAVINMCGQMVRLARGRGRPGRSDRTRGDGR